MKKSKGPAILEHIEQQPLSVFTEKAYLDYSMYVILDRALPHISDGLKPVQRRIIYAMSELGLNAGAKFKKAARTVGDVLGKFHPHGDTACYEAMVLMAQPFSYRYPLIEGQGNFGSPDDPKSFAAMRYTEAKLSKFAEVFLGELEHGTVDWAPNFDGTLEEPKFLPARVPTILLNGITGIAVGMATDIPPHNLGEVVEASLHLLANPEATVADLCKFIKGPDFPTDAEIITSKEEIRKMYETGNGSIRMRAVYTVEKDEIVITALPHQCSGAKVLEQIAQQMQAKKLPMIADLRDESDHRVPTRLVIVLKENKIDIEQFMGHLFVTTDLEKTYRVNINVIGLDGRPQVKNLAVLLNEWITFRLATIKRRLEHRLDKVTARLHTLDGLLIAYFNLDAVIKIIREAEDPKVTLMKKFNLSEDQTNSILDLKLRHLSRLEEVKIKAEQSELAAEKVELLEILASNAKLKGLVRQELVSDSAKFSDKRRAKLVKREEAKVIDETELVTAEPITVVLSDKGWVRAAKGHEIVGTELTYKSGDAFKSQVLAITNQQLVFLDSMGKSYCVMAHTLPSARGYGEPLTSKLTTSPGANFEGMLVDNNEDPFVLMVSDFGYGFFAKMSDLLTKNKNGKTVLKLQDGAKLIAPAVSNTLDKMLVVVATSDNRLLVFKADELPQMEKGKGNKMINIPAKNLESKDELVVSVALIKEKEKLCICTDKKKVILTAQELKEYLGSRGLRGNKLPKAAFGVKSLEVG